MARVELEDNLKMTISKIAAFEKEADNLAKNLALIDQPIEDLLHQFFGTVEVLFSEGKQREGFDLLSRLSYLPSILPRTASETPLPMQERLIHEGRDLTSYLHFSELMPQIHNEYLEALEEGDNFQLKHKDLESSIYEIKDVLMADLSRPFITYSPSFSIEETATILNATSSTKFPVELAREKIGNKLESYWDIFKISDAAFQQVLRITIKELNELRAFMLAYADFLQAIIELNKQNFISDNSSESARSNFFKAIFPFFPGETLIEEIELCTSLDKSKILIILSFFTFSSGVNGSKNLHCRDGYLPPILKTQKGHYFYPSALSSFISNRNLLLALKEFNRKDFDSIMSGTFEPSLLEAIKAELDSVGSLQVRLNQSWSRNSLGGEIDILVYHTTLKKALVIEVKAFIPPQGARMVKNISSRVKEGIEQIIKFRHLSVQDREAIVSDSLGLQVSGIEISEVILVSSCLGSSEAWSKLESENICGTNYLLFKLLINKVIQKNDPGLLFDIPIWTKNKLTDLVANSHIQWEEREFDLFGRKISFPSWTIDEQPLRELRKEIFHIQS